MNFRYDINGLRAIAVIAVVLFHFNSTWVPGGFSGVDVFFVISGFLMTGIIFRGLENSHFSLLKFYLARASRIIPALTVLCLVLLVFGWFYLNPLDYKALGKHVYKSILFGSNHTYLKESGYFDVASKEKLLLHTWSLSVEWQFYIIYPFILMALKRFLPLEKLKQFIVAGTVLGFTFCVIFTIKWPDGAYYLLVSRAWEMMMGGVAFLYPWNVSEKKKKIAEVLGLLLILSSYIFVSSELPWPGHFALIPVLGAYLVIVSNQQTSFITNNIVFQYLGRWSYSIYLWHWPIVVFGYYFALSSWVWGGVALSIGLGFLSFKFIECYKFKKSSLLGMCVLLCIFGRIAYKADNIPRLFVPEKLTKVSFYNSQGSFTWDEHTKRSLLNFTSEKKKILIIGDSQAGDLLNILIKSGVDSDYEIVTRMTSTYCSLLYISDDDISNYVRGNIYIPKDTTFNSCLNEINNIWSRNVVEQADYIFIAMNIREPSIPFLQAGLEEISKNSEADISIFGMKSILAKGSGIIAFNYYYTPKDRDMELNEFATKYIHKETEIDNINISHIAKNSNVNYVDLGRILCRETSCEVLHNGNAIYYDFIHTTVDGAEFFGGQIRGFLSI